MTNMAFRSGRAKLDSGHDWPEGDYIHAFCSDCATTFLGPKRSSRCWPCENEASSQTAPVHVIWFQSDNPQENRTSADHPRAPGLPLDILPDGLPVRARAFYARSRCLSGLVMAQATDEQLGQLVEVAHQAGRIAIRQDGDDAVRQWNDGRRIHQTGFAKADSEPLRHMSEAPRDGTPVLLRFHSRLARIRADLERWDDLVFVGRNRADEGGHDEWGFAAPVGQGGFPDAWLQGWEALT